MSRSLGKLSAYEWLRLRRLVAGLVRNQRLAKANRLLQEAKVWSGSLPEDFSSLEQLVKQGS